MKKCLIILNTLFLIASFAYAENIPNDESLWHSINNLEDIESYLKHYPDGQYSIIASEIIKDNNIVKGITERGFSNRYIIQEDKVAKAFNYEYMKKDAPWGYILINKENIDVVVGNYIKVASAVSYQTYWDKVKGTNKLDKWEYYNIFGNKSILVCKKNNSAIKYNSPGKPKTVALIISDDSLPIRTPISPPQLTLTLGDFIPKFQNVNKLIISSDQNNPLKFAVIHGIGLVHIGGSGSIEDKSGRIIKLE